MANYFQLAWVFAILALGAAEPPRGFNRRFQNRNRFFARQEEAPSSSPAPTPYPPAGIKPDIPFELPNQEATSFSEPDQTYGPPDKTYGPPAPTQLEAATPDQTYGLPDQTYGAPLPEQPEVEDLDEQATDEPLAERLIFIRRNPNQAIRVKQNLAFRPAALRKPIVFKKSAVLRQPARFQ